MTLPTGASILKHGLVLMEVTFGKKSDYTVFVFIKFYVKLKYSFNIGKIYCGLINFTSEFSARIKPEPNDDTFGRAAQLTILRGEGMIAICLSVPRKWRVSYTNRSHVASKKYLFWLKII